MSHTTEKLLVCPYNKAHTILSYRMQTHLHKCRKQHADLEWGSCSHNSTHQMPCVELQFHEAHTCPDRHSFQAMHYATSAEPEALVPIVPIYIPEPEEDWENGPVNCFDPNKNAEEKSLFRGKHCVPPSERKTFRINHRLATAERVEEERLAIGTSSSSSSKKTDVKEKASNMEPLRPPQTIPRGFVGRGAILKTDEVPKSPGMTKDTVNLSRAGAGQEAAGSTKIQWAGIGRGKPTHEAPLSAAPSSSSFAPAAPAPSLGGAWGRGRPKF